MLRGLRCSDCRNSEGNTYQCPDSSYVTAFDRSLAATNKHGLNRHEKRISE